MIHPEDIGDFEYKRRKEDAILFESEEWLESVREFVEPMIEEDKTIRRVAEKLGIVESINLSVDSFTEDEEEIEETYDEEYEEYARDAREYWGN